MVDTVKFNVGGRHFEVSRDLIEQNPDTMLARMISETWENEPDKPMFIDRDGDLFAQVLNYLRYGSIELSPTIPQAMFKRELDYYSIPAIDGSVSQEPKKSPAEVTAEMGKQEKAVRIFNLAVECYSSFHKEIVGPHGKGVKFVIERTHELYQDFNAIYSNSSDVKLLNAYLGENFGLCVCTTKYKRYEVSMTIMDTCFCLSIKE